MDLAFTHKSKKNPAHPEFEKAAHRISSFCFLVLLTTSIIENLDEEHIQLVQNGESLPVRPLPQRAGGQSS